MGKPLTMLWEVMGMPSELWPHQQIGDYFGWISHFLLGREPNGNGRREE
ncbi:hypothetical protein [Serratia sp. DD3]|nr:hypothetical protein [Serratia sp. DD3]